MKWSLLFITTLLAFSEVCFCQTPDEIVSKEIVLIKQIPQNLKDGKKKIKPDDHYLKIVKLDTLALSGLLALITDTTLTDVIDVCSNKHLVSGDVALCLINSIVPIFPHMVFGGQWDLIMLCGPETPTSMLDYFHSQRGLASKQMREFFQSNNGKTFIKFLKTDYGKTHDFTKFMQSIN